MSKPTRLERWLFRILVVGLITSVALGWFIFHDEPQPDLSDFAYPTTEAPEQDNAYWLLLDAARISPEPPESPELDDQTQNRPSWESYLVGTADERTRRFAEQSELWTLLNAADSARHSIAPRNTDLAYLFPEDQSLHTTWVILLARAIHAAEGGDFRAAFDDIDLALRLARRLEAAQNDLLPFILSQVLFADSLIALQLVADKCTDPQALAAMIKGLEHRRGSKEHLLRTFRNQANIGLTILESRSSVLRAFQTAKHLHRVAPSWLPDSLMLPLFNAHQSQRIYADFMRDSIAMLDLPADQVRQRNLELYEHLDQELHGPLITLPRNLQGKIMLSALIPPLGGVLKTRAKIETQLDLTRLYLALRLYSLRHDTLPDRLEELVPSFIAALPLDPFSKASFAYDASARTLSSAGKRKIPDHTLSSSLPSDPLLLHLRFADKAQAATSSEID